MRKFINALKSYKFSSYMLAITIFYAMGSILINLMAVKTFGYAGGGNFGGFSKDIISVTTAGSLISWLVFGAIDVITEVSGKKKAIQTFWIVGILNVILTVIAALAVFIPGVSSTTADYYASVFGGNWGIAVSSILAFLLGNYANTIIMYVMKTRATDPKSGKGFLVRIIVSTLVGQFIDNAFFYILALAPGFGLGGLTNPAVLCGAYISGFNAEGAVMWACDIAQGWKQLFMMVGFTTLIELGVEALFSPVFHKFSQFLINKKEAEGVTE